MAAAITWADGRIDNSDTLISSFSFDDALSQTYSLKITCHGNADALLPKAFDHLTFNFNKQEISGMLLKVTKHQDFIKKRWDYVLEVRPRLHVLALRRTINLYPNKSINAILLDLLQNARTSLGTKNLDYDNLISDTLFTTPFNRLEISYAQNDLEYLQALLQYGARFCFEETDEGEQVIFVDAPYKLPHHQESLKFTPQQKEDVHQDQPLIYQVSQKNNLLPAQGCAIFYDPKAAVASLNNLMQGNKTPNDNTINMSGAPLIYMSDCYSPPAIEAAMSERVDQLIHHDQHRYELYSYYSGLRAGQQISFENINGFIERVQLTGVFEHDAWRFDSSATLRSFSDQSWLGPLLERMPLPPTLTGAEIQGDDQVNDLGEFKIKFPTRFITDSNNDPWVSFRDVQATTTSEGGASNSMSGNAEVLIASQNGASYDWMILGSLDNNERPSNVSAQNYRESKINTTGGVNVHLRRQDSSNPYSELNMAMTDTQNNSAGINLGTSIPSMQSDTEQHGIQEISSGYGKRSIMGNLYDTVGNVEDPVHQVALTQDAASGMTTLNKQTNVCDSGVYNKSYFVSSVGAQNISKATAADMANYSDEFKLFVATVYGESIGQGPAAWQAVASVIMNRVNKYEWTGKYTTVTAVIEEKGAFSTYYDPKLKGPDAQFKKAINYLNNEKETVPADLNCLIQIVYPIYNKTQKSITQAVLYYSPNVMDEPTDIQKGLLHKSLEEVFVPGVSTEYFRFFQYKR